MYWRVIAPATTQQQCQYDAWNRLVSVSEGKNLVAKYAYGGLGRLVLRTTYSPHFERRQYVYDQQGNLLQEWVSHQHEKGFRLDNEYIWGPAGLVCRTKDDQRHYAL